MTLARDGMREMLIATLIFGVPAGVLCRLGLNGSPLYFSAAAIPAACWVFCLAFFRVPRRHCPREPGLIVSPADGKVTEVTTLERYDGIDEPVVRIGIFLSVFDVHVNYIPCDGAVKSVEYRSGEFLDARHPECGVRNESNTLVVQPREFDRPLIVRQIAGLIARRIVCRVRAGDHVFRGRRYGLIKFGSRAEVIAPISTGLTAAVRVGDRVRGGETVLFRLESFNRKSATANMQTAIGALVEASS